MKDAREKLMSHILMVVAPLLVLLMITVAWFVNSRTIGLSEMSFAAQDSGPGAALYKTTAITNWKYDGAVTPATVTNTVLWGKEELPENSDITIHNIVPGQTEYYLLVSKDKFNVRLLNVKWFADGSDVDLETGASLPLAQCIGLYLLPVDADQLPDDIEGSTSTPTISLVRESADGPLSAACLKGNAPGEKEYLPVTGAATAPQRAYILAVYCDPLYLQDGPTQVSHLPGTISFSLAFDKAEEP